VFFFLVGVCLSILLPYFWYLMALSHILEELAEETIPNATCPCPGSFFAQLGDIRSRIIWVFIISHFPIKAATALINYNKQ